MNDWVADIFSFRDLIAIHTAAMTNIVRSQTLLGSSARLSMRTALISALPRIQIFLSSQFKRVHAWEIALRNSLCSTPHSATILLPLTTVTMSSSSFKMEPRRILKFVQLSPTPGRRKEIHSLNNSSKSLNSSEKYIINSEKCEIRFMHNATWSESWVSQCIFLSII